MPTVRRARIKSSEFYKLRGKVDTVMPLVEKVFADLIKGITVPLTPEEMNPPKQKTDTDGPTTIKITGASHPEAVEAFNEDYLNRRWGDGLPLVPPTPERVRWMLNGTKRQPNEVIGKINPKHGIVTVEKIAINAVMAGAKPEYLPVIIAGIEIIADEVKRAYAGS